MCRYNDPSSSDRSLTRRCLALWCWHEQLAVFNSLLIPSHMCWDVSHDKSDKCLLLFQFLWGKFTATDKLLLLGGKMALAIHFSTCRHTWHKILTRYLGHSAHEMMSLAAWSLQTPTGDEFPSAMGMGGRTGTLSIFQSSCVTENITSECLTSQGGDGTSRTAHMH